MCVCERERRGREGRGEREEREFSALHFSMFKKEERKELRENIVDYGRTFMITKEQRGVTVLTFLDVYRQVILP